MVSYLGFQRTGRDFGGLVELGWAWAARPEEVRWRLIGQSHARLHSKDSLAPPHPELQRSKFRTSTFKH